MQLPIAREALDRGDVGTVGLNRENGAGLHCYAVHVDGARTALAGVTTDVRAGEGQSVTQEVDEEGARLDV
jgi:hypothetical protein